MLVHLISEWIQLLKLNLLIPTGEERKEGDGRGE